MAVLRITAALFVVLQELLASDQRFGLDLMKKTGLPSGTVYPILARLEEAGMVESEWDTSPARGPRRRLYSLTPKGVQEAQRAEASLTPAARVMAGVWARPQDEGGGRSL